MTVSRIRAPGEVSQVPPPLTLYLHLPWCVSKCPYCDFNSHKSPSRLPEEDYTRALLRDMETALPAVWGRPIQSIFIGGGTPSLFSPKSIDALLSGVRQLFNPAPGIEITMEANPDSADAKKFGEFRDIGVNRLSLGVQSFADDSLRRLKRPHDGAQAHHAAEAARLAFDNVNLDLIHALPAQSPDEAVSDVRQATAHAPTHLSLYQLTLEPGTPFHRQPPDRLPDEEKTAAMTDAVAAAAEEVGYPRYEVSAYAKPANRCRHNLNYWRFGDYLGVGAGAHSKMTREGKIIREQRWKDPNRYVRSTATAESVSERRQLRGDDAVFECLLNGLRLREGIALTLLHERAGVPGEEMRQALQTAEDEGLLIVDKQHLRTTDHGALYLNELLLRLLPESPLPAAPTLHQKKDGDRRRRQHCQ